MMKKLIWVTTVAQSMGLFKGQLHYLSGYFDLTFVASNEHNPQELLERGKAERIDVHEISMKRPIALMQDIRSLFSFIFFFYHVRPDIVHGNTPKGALLSMVASKLTGVRTRIYMCHGLRYQGGKGIMKRVLMQMERITCACATQVLCVSDGVRNTLVKDKICPASKSVVIWNGSCNGINPDYFSPSLYSTVEKEKLRAQYGIKSDEFLLIYIGRIVKDKGIDELVEAYIRYRKENPKVRLMILGAFEDEINPVCKNSSTVIKGNKEGIVYCGKQTDVRPFLSTAQCLVLPSYREGFGLVLMEAGAMSVPVICSNIVGCNSVVNEDNGLLVTPKDTEDLYFKIKQMVDNTQMYQHFRMRTRESIISRFNQSVLWERFLAYYQGATYKPT